MARKFYYGGQAVIEGVMMRGKKAMVTAVRQPDGSLTMDVQALSSLYTGRWRKVPLVRGVIALIEALVLGIQSLMYSANVALGEDQHYSRPALWGIMAVAFALAIGLFFMVPLFITRLVNPMIQSSLLFNFIEGMIRLAIFVGYLKLVGMMPDIRRIFSYHGAEHKAVNAMEHGAQMEVAQVRPYSTAHVRCGTSFLFAVMVVAILVFSVVGRPALPLMVLSRVVLIPVIAAVAYEFTFFGANHVNNALVRASLVPGLLLQKLTTGEPDDSQIEVACAALKRAAALDVEAEAPAPVSLADTPA